MSDSSSSHNPRPDMAAVRREIDRVDNALLDLIAQRLELAKAVRRAKSGVRVWRPSREDEHVRDLAAAAGETTPALVSTIWAELMSASLALQGPMRLHIALEGDALTAWTLVRDRFGASIPAVAYPTASAALAAAYAEDEGVAVLPAPGVMNTWWAALCPGGAAPSMNILAGLPRVGAQNWPTAVAVATCARAPSGVDQTLLAVSGVSAVQEAKAAGFTPVLRSETAGMALLTVDGFIANEDAQFMALKAQVESVKIIGVLPRPLSEKVPE